LATITSPEMADVILLRALTAKKLNLSSKHLEKVPRIIGKLSAVIDIQLKNNKLTDLPEEFGNLVKVRRKSIGPRSSSCGAQTG